MGTKLDCTPEVRQTVKVVYSEREITDHEYQAPHLYQIFTKEFKQQILREVQAGKSIAQSAREHELHPNLIGKWQKLHEQYAQDAFQGNGHAYTQEAKIAELERLIGQQTVEINFLKKVLAIQEQQRQEAKP